LALHFNTCCVITGLDPVIPLGKALRPERDCRVKPGNDE
jgi:hypothetical protein